MGKPLTKNASIPKKKVQLKKAYEKVTYTCAASVTYEKESYTCSASGKNFINCSKFKKTYEKETYTSAVCGKHFITCSKLR